MLNQTCAYALRAVTYIAGEEGRPVMAKEISENVSVPLKYLQKVLTELVRRNVLTSTRGIGGGFRLRHSPSRIRLAKVVEAFDDSFGRTSCPFGNARCGVSDPCPVHDQWSRIVEEYQYFLQVTTVGDLVETGGKVAGF